MQQEIEKRITLKDTKEAFAILGPNDEYIRLVGEQFNARITTRGDEIVICGEMTEVEQVVQLFNELLYLHRSGNPFTTHDLRYAIKIIKAGQENDLHQMFADTITVTARGRHIKPKTLGQKRYIEAIRQNHVTFGIGPAGTGKTYLAVAMAVFSLKSKLVDRIVLTRPAVEAGEKLGFLPGDLQEKVDPYLRPLYDALYDLLGTETFEKYMSRNIIEVAPLAYMRGRTINDSFIILDEAQNTTPQQMKMFLTRFGFGSKMVITGDVTQIDLPSGARSGLIQAQEVVQGLEGVSCIPLTAYDVMRHEIVGRIIKAYDSFEQKRQ